MKEMDFRKTTDIMPLSFLYLKLVGAWKPSSLPRYLGVFYDVYTIAMVFFIIKVVIITEILCVIFAEENQPQVLKDNVHIICTMINGWSKMINIIMRRGNIVSLVNRCVGKDWNPPRDQDESLIFAASKNSSRRVNLFYTSVVAACVISTLMNAMISPLQFLPLNAWYPCNVSLPICFWTCYAHQGIGYAFDAIVHVANDNLIVGFMLQICAQLNVLNLRLVSIHSKLEEAD